MSPMICVVSIGVTGTHLPHSLPDVAVGYVLKRYKMFA